MSPDSVAGRVALTTCRRGWAARSGDTAPSYPLRQPAQAGFVAVAASSSRPARVGSTVGDTAPPTPCVSPRRRAS
ncbi:MAG: hypothetical protein M3Z04_03760 [Chloroflexota bacterium]|nr:hypothetical protein [Chloroflexota bacterium]